MSYKYSELKDRYQVAKELGLVKDESLQDWSRQWREFSGNQDFRHTEHANVLKDIAEATTGRISSSRLADFFAEVSGNVGSALGFNREPFEAVGREVPKTALLASLPLIGGAIGSVVPGVGTAIGASAGAGLSALLAGLDAYTATDSPTWGVASAALMRGAPGLYKLGEAATVKALGGTVIRGEVAKDVAQFVRTGATETVTEVIPRTATQAIGGFVGGNVAQMAAGEVGYIASTLIDNNLPKYEFDVSQLAAELTVGQLPFLPLNIYTAKNQLFGFNKAADLEREIRMQLDLTEQLKQRREYAEEVLAKPLNDFRVPTSDELEKRIETIPQILAKGDVETAKQLFDWEVQEDRLKDVAEFWKQNTELADRPDASLLTVDLLKNPELNRERVIENYKFLVELAEKPQEAQPMVELQEQLKGFENQFARMAQDEKFMETVRKAAKGEAPVPLLNKPFEEKPADFESTDELETAGQIAEKPLEYIKDELARRDFAPIVPRTAIKFVRDVPFSGLAAKKGEDQFELYLNWDVVKYAKEDELSELLKHEFRHLATMEKAAKDEKVQAAMEASIAKLPKKLQAIVAKARESGFYDRLVRGQATLSELGDLKPKELEKVYAHLSPVEFAVYSGNLDAVDTSLLSKLRAKNAAESNLRKAGFTQAEAYEFTNRAFALREARLSNYEQLVDRLFEKPSPRLQAASRFLGVFRQEYNDEILRAAGYNHLLDFTKDLLLGKPKVEDPEIFMLMLDAPARKFVHDALQEAWGTTVALNSMRRKGGLDVSEFTQNVARRVRLDREIYRITDNLLSLNKLDFYSFATLPLKIYGENYTVPKPLLTFARATHVGRWDPQFGKMLEEAHQVNSLSRRMIVDSYKAFGYDTETGTIDPKSLRVLFDNLADRQIVKAVDKILFAAQQENPSAVKPLPLSHPRVQEVLAALPEQKRLAVEDLLHKFSVSKKKHDEYVLKMMREVYTETMKPVVYRLLERKVDNVGELFDAFVQVEAGNVNKLQEMQQQFDIKQLNALYRYFSPLANAYIEYAQYLAENPWWVTARRYGKFNALLSNGNRIGGDSIEELRLLAKEQGAEIVETYRDKWEDKRPLFANDGAKIIDKLRQYEENFFSMFGELFSPEQVKLLRRYSAVEQFAVEAKAQNLPIEARPRSLKRGAEHLSMLKNHLQYIQRDSMYWSRRLLQTKVLSMMEDPEYAGRPDLRELFARHVENIMFPDPEFTEALTKFTTAWTIGFNVSTALTNGVQPIQRALPELVQMKGSVTQALKALGEAYAKLGTDKLTQEERDMLRRAAVEGELSMSVYDEAQVNNELIGVQLYRRVKHTDGVVKSEWLKSKLHDLFAGSMLMFRAIETFNSKVALLTAFNHYRSQGMPAELAYDRAVDFNRAVNDIGGRLNRPIGLFSNRDPFSRSAAMIAYNLQGYLSGFVGHTALMVRDGWFNAKLKPNEKYAARKALATVMAVQLALAGLRLPFLALPVYAFANLFGINLRTTMRDFLQQLFNEDDDNATPLTDIAMDGLLNTIGWDVSSKVALSGVPGFDERSGVQLQNLAVPISLAWRLGQGVGAAAQGDMDKALLYLSPAFMRRIVELAIGEGALRDSRDRIIYEPRDWEKVGMLLGYAPAKRSKLGEAIREQAAAEQWYITQTARRRTELAELLLQGKVGTVKRELSELKDKIDVESEIRSIVDRAVELHFARDLRSKPDYGNVLEIYRVPRTGPTEVQRLQLRDALLQRFGLRVRPQDYQIAEQIEALRQRYPYAPTSELRKAVLGKPARLEE